MDKKNNYPCKLIEDLLPLYVEEEVSDISREIVEVHVKECDSCREQMESMSENTDPVLDKMKESLPETATFRQWMERLKKGAILLLAVVVVITLLVSGISYQFGLNREQPPPVHYVDTEEEIYAFFHDKVPGLLRAEEAGWVIDMHQEIEIPNGAGTFAIDRVWYTKEHIYIFYQMDGRIPYMSHPRFNWLTSTGEVDHSSVQYFDGAMSTGEGVVFDNVYYSYYVFSNTYEMAERAEEIVVRDVSLDLEVAFRSNPADGEKISVPEMLFSIEYDPNLNTTLIVDVEGKLKIDEIGEFIFHQIVLEPQKSYLLFDFESSLEGNGSRKNTLESESDRFADDQIYLMAGTLKTDTGEEVTLWSSPEPNGTGSQANEDSTVDVEKGGDQNPRENQEIPYYRIQFEALNTIPSSFELELEGLKLITGESLTFDIEASDFHGEMDSPGQSKELNEIIANVRGTSIYLDRLYWDDRGVMFQLSHEFDYSGGDNAIDRISTSEIYDVWFQESIQQSASMNDTWRLPNLVSIVNDTGLNAGTEDFGSRGSGRDGEWSRPYISMFIDKDYVEASKKMTITVSQLTDRLTGPWNGDLRVIHEE
ncbi:zf-HC2 domain-containing protein [Evansella tamaricis]|uniref:Zf-HC2 domain-containing protein n=1 Tax=Evansella tamaricis TaxID=2069301 RepID=A0ABS6JCX9_9BACI|nr:zf-HC2 domain-containing protein [Evansella tamaricis]MBU9711523.1 zf-HC2 domain-containing protein [Evansella tamaricis]